MKRIGIALIVAVLLSACSDLAKDDFQWQVNVNLSTEKRAEYEQRAQTLEQQIRTYQPIKDDDSLYAPIPDFIDLARAYESLGDYRSAMATYQKALSLHRQSQVIVHNMGRLYEKVRDYSRAASQYQELIDDYSQRDYWYDITWAWIRAGERQKAEKAFNQWQNIFQKTDEQTQRAIQQLREQEQKPPNS